MPLSSKPAFSGPRNGRVPATAVIWGCATGMIAICLPLSASHSGTMISIAIVSAAAVSTMTVWLSGGITTQANVEESDLQDLKERMESLEAIANANHLDLQPQVQPATEGDREF